MALSGALHVVVEYERDGVLTLDVIEARTVCIGPADLTMEDATGKRWHVPAADCLTTRDAASARLHNNAKAALRRTLDAARAGDPSASARHAQLIEAIARFERAEGLFARERTYDYDSLDRNGEGRWERERTA